MADQQKNKFVENELVYGKVKGYPYWPASVSHISLTVSFIE